MARTRIDDMQHAWANLRRKVWRRQASSLMAEESVDRKAADVEQTSTDPRVQQHALGVIIWQKPSCHGSFPPERVDADGIRHNVERERDVTSRAGDFAEEKPVKWISTADGGGLLTFDQLAEDPDLAAKKPHSPLHQIASVDPAITLFHSPELVDQRQVATACSFVEARGGESESVDDQAFG